MSGILTRQTCAAVHEYDMVGLRFGSCRFSMYYQTAFFIAAGALSSAKLAARFESVNPAHWVTMIDTSQQDALQEFSREYRRSGQQPNFKKWEVRFQGNLVQFVFDEEIITTHYSDVYDIYVSIRLAAKNAKRWAGDSSRQWTTRAHLVDAEENDKFVYV